MPRALHPTLFVFADIFFFAPLESQAETYPMRRR